MKILIVGPGAVGTALGARFVSAGAEVKWLGRSAFTRSVRVVWDASASSFEQKVLDRTPSDWQPDQVWVAVRAPEFAQALEIVRGMGFPAGRVWIASNGLGLWDQAREVLGDEPVRVGVTFGASWSEISGAATELSCSGEPGIWVSEGLGESARFLERCGFILREEASSRRVEWRKALVNSCINALAALAGVTNGELVSNPETVEWMRVLYQEALEAARADGEVFETEEFEHVLRVARQTAKNRNSTCWDLRVGRKTEIPWLNGYIARRLAELGKPRSFHGMLNELVGLYRT